MNETISTLQAHRSIRTYTDKPVQDDVLQSIFQSIQAAPTWINGQQLTVIHVTDQKKKDTLAELAGNQRYVAEAPVFLVFCLDFNRAKKASEKAEKPFGAQSMEDLLLVGATDVGLGMGNAIAAAESHGLGVVPIGGVRRSIDALSDELGLPELVVPVAGLCIGYPAADPGLKPRFEQDVVIQQDSYKEVTAEQLEEMDRRMAEFSAGSARPTDWTSRVATFYEKPYYSGIDAFLRKKGFLS